MSRALFLIFIVAVWLMGCSPVFNWREVRLGEGGFKALLPCKPDQASRPLPLLGRQVELRMIGCEAGDALFALSMIEVGDASRLAEAQTQWQAAMLTTMRAAAPRVGVHAFKGAAVTPAPVRLTAQGHRPDGRTVQAQALWFAQGTRLYHAAVYAERLRTDAVEPFMFGLELP